MRSLPIDDYCSMIARGFGGVATTRGWAPIPRRLLVVLMRGIPVREVEPTQRRGVEEERSSLPLSRSHALERV